MPSGARDPGPSAARPRDAPRVPLRWKVGPSSQLPAPSRIDRATLPGYGPAPRSGFLRPGAGSVQVAPALTAEGPVARFRTRSRTPVVTLAKQPGDAHGIGSR